MRDSEYIADVEYEIWRRGGNPDRVDRDRCIDANHEGIESEDYASLLMRREADRRDAIRQEEWDRQQAEEEYYRDMQDEGQQS